ncbi:hypothetical protein Ctob_006916 [Chrysochromulina tobinii]|uniref:Uncharacterized protein n=1 Tax=Chrysochromulina tobinii TaxID=1460289 RepID=A0A0M0JSX0_9EUKA|nr:hypothetical protein Ctob_006916 [Chrysochromulina tobinii]|eukprot:KOO29689.1 hypothetical protein Ctob_006916 [Chrysochromulina sp. CCMP291]
MAVDGERWLIGDQQLSTKEFYGLIAQISGQPAPAYEIPAWLARISARGLTIWSNWAIDYVTDVTMHTGAKGIADAIAAADERGPLVSAQE